jgi:hypothetical protein
MNKRCRKGVAIASTTPAIELTDSDCSFLTDDEEEIKSQNLSLKQKKLASLTSMSHCFVKRSNGVALSQNLIKNKIS